MLCPPSCCFLQRVSVQGMTIHEAWWVPRRAIVGSLGKRLDRLEKRYEDRLAAADEEVTNALFKEVFKRLSDEELDACDQALERLLNTGKPAEEDRWIFARVDRLYQEAERER
jgi:hypothetical protein